ncbi:MAG: hypothetical protein COU67_02485 [Candidatus Pacebacteria bacterium CG10_big_fil_rev_8_21_14_0_10_44_54]|nr:MAG: hypothetical protein COU67_02485 [Candidatus Pacebacteria bacterium CG10_big_fil_rev_8_21_14_0_10_44_54]
MQSIANKKPVNQAAAQHSNPFARALAESEKSSYDSPANTTGKNDLSEALARTGGQLPDFQNQNSPDFLRQQQADLAEKQKHEALRKKLHDQINPVDARDIFSAREKQVTEEIEQLRQELKLLVGDVAKFEKEVELTLMTEVVDPGLQGKYFLNFFQQLRSFIMLLRQKIKSARTWSSAFSQKSKKKKKHKGGAGMIVEGQGHEKTSTVQDMMHHERSSSYGGS